MDLTWPEALPHGDVVADSRKEVDVVIAVTDADGVLAVNVELAEHLAS